MDLEMALRYWLNVNGGAKIDKSGSPSGHSLQSQVCTYSFIVAVPLEGDPMIAGFLLVELGLWLGDRLMRSHMEAAGARAEL